MIPEGTTIHLEGYGQFEGKKREVIFVGMKSDDEAVVQVTIKGQTAQKTFRITDGKALDAKTEMGYKLPAELIANPPKKGVKPRPTKANPNPSSRAKGESKPRTPKLRIEVNPEGKCFCGCNADTPTHSKFRPGHDARAHGRIKKYLRGDLEQEDLQTEHKYIQDHVAEGGGFNSQERPPVVKKEKQEEKPVEA